MESGNVVLIDADKEFVGELKNIVRASGYTPVVINDSLLAVDRVVEMKPDVIVLELNMPRKNGFVIAFEINRVFETQRIPIIAMSSHPKEAVFPLLNICGISKFIQKPFKPLDIIWAIQNVAEESSHDKKKL